MTLLLDATNAVLGRIASHAAKQALIGKNVIVVNCEKAIVSGRKSYILERYIHRRSRGQPMYGPFIPRLPDRFVRRIIRGMLPWDKPKGKLAFKRVMCYTGMPSIVVGTPETFANASLAQLGTVNYMTVGDLCRHLGGKA
ncbi:50S ribosomal protein L13 [Candidatus Woesearchaeota archaeon]|nr:50S ribosomal protein L13 [Candidatus Woesearchaeota archaeon]